MQKKQKKKIKKDMTVRRAKVNVGLRILALQRMFILAVILRTNMGRFYEPYFWVHQAKIVRKRILI